MGRDLKPHSVPTSLPRAEMPSTRPSYCNCALESIILVSKLLTLHIILPITFKKINASYTIWKTTVDEMQQQKSSTTNFQQSHFFFTPIRPDHEHTTPRASLVWELPPQDFKLSSQQHQLSTKN